LRAVTPSPFGEIAGLYIFDFDGTLSSIVPDRNAAYLHPACRQLLNALAQKPGRFVAVHHRHVLPEAVAMLGPSGKAEALLRKLSEEFLAGEPDAAERRETLSRLWK
jgi:Trehalose-6-phosphatase